MSNIMGHVGVTSESHRSHVGTNSILRERMLEGVSKDLRQIVGQIRALVREVGKDGIQEDGLDELANQLLEVIAEIPPLDTQQDSHKNAQPEIETSAVTLWNFAVAKKTSGNFTASLNAKVRHVAFKLVYLCNANTSEEATLRKQIMMALKTARAWLDCSNPSMADNPLTMAEEFIDRLQKALESTLAAGGDADSENFAKKKAALQRDLFKVVCYQAEAACGQSQNELALKSIQRAKEMLPSCPSEGPYVTMLCFNFGVDEFQRSEYENSIGWLRLSFDIGKTNNNATPKNQARTLRLLANSYLEWDSKQHWQKALNAIGLANSEHSHPAGLYLKLRILLEGEAPDDRLSAAVDEMLRHSELTVDLGITTLRLVSKYKRNDICFDSLGQLSKRFDTSLDLGSIWSAHLELLLNNNMMEAASKATEGYITAHKTNKPMDVGSQKQFHLLFWDAAARAFEKKDFPLALKWYNYSLSMFNSVEEMDANLAKLHRNRASCFISLGQLEEAGSAIDLAEKCDTTSPHTYYLMYKIALLQDEDKKALDALNKMCSCEEHLSGDITPDGLMGDHGPTLHGLISLAAHLAMERSNREVALTALQGLVGRPSCPQQVLTASRCLVRLRISLLDQPGADKSEIRTILKNIEVAYEKLLELSTTSNRGGVDVNDEATWFMKISWNLALRCGDELMEMHHLYILCYKLNALCMEDMAGLARQKTCLLMAAAALLHLNKSKTDQAEKKELLEKVVSYCSECHSILAKIEDAQIAESGTTSTDTTTPILLTLYEFEAQCKLGGAGLESILEHAISLPKADPKTFETIAALAMEPPSHHRNLSVRALKVAIKKHLQNPNIDYEKCSKAFHSLVEMALEKGSALDAKDEAWGYYMDVIHVIENAATDQYPEMETLWLMTKAWNCGIHHYSGGKYEESRRWCEMALRLLKHLPSLQKNYDKHMNTVYSDILAKVDSSKQAGITV